MLFKVLIKTNFRLFLKSKPLIKPFKFYYFNILKINYFVFNSNDRNRTILFCRYFRPDQFTIFPFHINFITASCLKPVTFPVFNSSGKAGRR